MAQQAIQQKEVKIRGNRDNKLMTRNTGINNIVIPPSAKKQRRFSCTSADIERQTMEFLAKVVRLKL